jgi:hypothetical protein
MDAQKVLEMLNEKIKLADDMMSMYSREASTLKCFKCALEKALEKELEASENIEPQN